MSHFYDLQSPIPDIKTPYAALEGPSARVGAPANNVELVLRGVEHPVTEKQQTSAQPGFGAAEALKGALHARGPALGAVSQAGKDVEG